MLDVILNDYVIPVDRFESGEEEGLLTIAIDFRVDSENYHAVAGLLYEGVFAVEVPEKGLAFRGAIQEYYTSVTNLYKDGEVGEYHLRLLEVKGEKR